MAHLTDPRFTPDPIYPQDHEVGKHESLADKIALIQQFRTTYPAVPQHHLFQVVVSHLDADTFFEININQMDSKDRFVRRWASLKVSFVAENDDYYRAYNEALVP